VGAVAASIEEEVARLNRVVTDVLDFARPIRYDISRADLVEICRDAAQAARTGQDAVAIHVRSHEHEAPIDTDVERLRAVLVNVLTNAEDAMRSRAEAGPASPILVRIGRNESSRWTVDVQDHGPGIAPEHLGRVFEPFFTTRKSGSGLGLALARNVIEGLGGSITIDSRAGAGTTVRLTLPDRPAASGARA